MNRCALALLGLLALPAAAAAQQERPLLANEPPPERLPESRFAITPYIGVRVPYTTGNVVVLGESGQQFVLQEERGGSTMAGINAEARLSGPVSFIAGVAYSGREQDTFVFLDGNGTGGTRVDTDGPAVLFAKAGVTWRLPDPIPDNRRFHPSAFLTVAPAMVFLDWQDADGVDEDISKTSSHFALNLGADATARIGGGKWAINLGAEDFLTFWNTDKLRTRAETINALVTDEQSVTLDYDYSNSNIIVLRFGLSYRM
ncbi:MAG TPA: hypothetical protein VFQ39_15565 [Longimicrobium sp.]|nr:hypothetical protein [Longimicrobium sp.]